MVRILITITTLLAFAYTPVYLTQETTPGVAPSTSSQPVPHIWSAQVKTEVAPDGITLLEETQKARQHKFANRFTANIDEQSNPHVASRVYLNHLPIDAVPANRSSTIVIATPTHFQPYLAENRSAVFTDLRLQVAKYISNASGVPEKQHLSILYSGGTIKTSKGRVVSTALASGSTPLEIGHKYVLFLNYEDDTKSFSIMRAWDISYEKPILLDESGINSALNDKEGVASQVELEKKISDQLLIRNSAIYR